MPGMGLVIEGAVQQAPQRGLHSKEVFMIVREAGRQVYREGRQNGRFPAEIPATLFLMNAGGIACRVHSNP
jgi:hypothetical protein